MVMLAALLSAALAAGPDAGISPRDSVEVVDLSGLSVSPDGKSIAFRTDAASVSDDRYRIGWYVVPADGRVPAQRIADGGDVIFDDAGGVGLEAPIWSPRSNAIYVRALIGDKVEVLRAPIDGATSIALTTDAADIRTFKLSVDGRSIDYTTGASRAELDAEERRGNDDGVLVDASVDLAQPVARGSIINGKPASQRLVGSWFDHGDLLWRTPTRYRVLGLPSQDVMPVTPGIAASGPAPAGAPATARRIVVDNQWRLEIDRAGHPPAVCETRQCRDGTPISATPLRDGQTWLVTTADAAQSQTLSLWRPGRPTAKTLIRGRGLLSGGRDSSAPCAISDTVAVCVEASASSPPRLVFVDLKTGRERVLFDPNSSLRARMSYPVRTLIWHGGDGTTFSGQLVLPSGKPAPGGFPLVMNYYDCPGFLRGGLGDELPIYPLARHGIATLCINEAHDPGGTRPRDWGYDRALYGVRAIVSQLSAHRLIDRGRVGMSGLSFGSEIVMLTMMRSDLLRAASISTGQIEPTFYWFNTVAGRDTAEIMKTVWGVGSPDSDRDGWKRISPALNIDKLRVPLLMQLPEQEARWSMQLYSSLSQTKIPVEMYAFANEAHNKGQPRHKFAVYERNLDWFRFWLTGERDDDPSKAAQYDRWTTLAKRWSDLRPPDRPSP